jgi:hypothetical protein
MCIQYVPNFIEICYVVSEIERATSRTQSLLSLRERILISDMKSSLYLKFKP